MLPGTTTHGTQTARVLVLTGLGARSPKRRRARATRPLESPAHDPLVLSGLWRRWPSLGPAPPSAATLSPLPLRVSCGRRTFLYRMETAGRFCGSHWEPRPLELPGPESALSIDIQGASRKAVRDTTPGGISAWPGPAGAPPGQGWCWACTGEDGSWASGLRVPGLTRLFPHTPLHSPGPFPPQLTPHLDRGRPVRLGIQIAL